MRVDFDWRLQLEFHGTPIACDAGLPAYRELDGALGLTDLTGGVGSNDRRGQDTRHLLTWLFHQCTAANAALIATAHALRNGRSAGIVDVTVANDAGALLAGGRARCATTQG
ncbi:MAG: hypothetical protein ACREFP_16785 [Acetobacteraceae bacterium]